MKDNSHSKEVSLNLNPVPIYKKLEASLNKDRDKLRIFNEEQQDLFPSIVTPTIYAFSAAELDRKNKGLDAVKVGDTHQADYTVRLNQWQKEYGDISEIGHTDAFFDLEGGDGIVERIYFRDYPVHGILEDRFGQERLKNKSFVMPGSFKSVSQEFFVPSSNYDPVSQKLLEEAKAIIEDDYKNGTSLYKTYRQPPLLVRNPKSVSYINDKPDNFNPYKYQEEASLALVEKFLNGMIDRSLGNLDNQEIRKVILDAPTRSGKSYMVCWALKALIQKIYGTYQGPKGVFSSRGSRKSEEATFSVITSGFPDVFDEFQRTIEKHKHFRKFFCWITKEQLLLNPNIIEEKQAEGYKHIVLALSLQDLAGRDGDKDLKRIHKLIEGKVDFVIGDECHFAMFSEAEAYKAALGEASAETALDEEEEEEIKKEFDAGHKAEFRLSPRYGYIFASATTYSVLDRNVFDRERDIVFVSPYAIQEETDRINRQYEDNPLNSPFFGRPQKHYFGIDLGCPASELFKANGRGEFVHAAEAKAVVSAFYGIGRYENLPELFSNDVLRAAGAGRHMLWQMPSKNACDALEKLLRELEVSDDYHLLNISSHKRNAWSGKSVYAIKDEIRRRRFEKTITITVARFVTGVSIAEWDSVILANSGQSLTRRIQTYGRVETPWVEAIDNGEEEQTKYCQKPNCFVFDLNPEQLYEFYNQVELHTNHLSDGASNKSEVVPGGNAFSFNGLQMKTMTRQDVHEQLDKYDGRRKIGEHTSRIDPAGEMEMTDALREIIEISGSAKNGKAQLGIMDEERATREFPEGENLDEEVVEDDTGEEAAAEAGAGEDSSNTGDFSEKEIKKLESDDSKRREFIYKRLMLASLLTEETGVKQLLVLLQSNKKYRQVANHIGLSQSMLLALQETCENFLVADRLERAMKSLLARSKEIAQTEGAEKEKRDKNETQRGAEAGLADAFILTISELETLSDNQVLTPPETAEKMVNALGLDFEKVADLLGNDNPDFIDTGAKSGVLLLAVYRRVCQIIEEALSSGKISKKRAEEMREEIGKHLVAVPTSAITYEIIRKLYQLMDWDEDNIWWSEAAPSHLKENWAYFIAQNTEDLQEIGALSRQKQKQEMRKWAEEKDLLATIKKEKREEEFLSFLVRIAKTMSEKFDYTISNPPYQIPYADGTNKAMPIYPNFIDAARQISDVIIMIHPARFLNNAGETSKQWNKSILEDPEFIVLEHFQNSKDAFPSADIKGGVAITLFEKGKVDGGYKDGYIGIPLLAEIKDKVWGKNSNIKGMESNVSSNSPFRYSNKSFTGRTDIRPTAFHKTKLFSKKKNKRALSVIGLDEKQKRATYYIEREKVKENPLIDSYKVFVPKANGSGALGEVVSTPLIGTPLMICTETFLSIGNFDNKQEAQNLLSYVKTKFARVMLGILKTTQNNSKDVWKYVPWQDFSKNSDIDWSKSIKEIDQQLYKKYGLTKKEIKFIEDNVQEMK